MALAGFCGAGAPVQVWRWRLGEDQSCAPSGSECAGAAGAGNRVNRAALKFCQARDLDPPTPVFRAPLVSIYLAENSQQIFRHWL
jgi:hypothetical protein